MKTVHSPIWLYQHTGRSYASFTAIFIRTLFNFHHHVWIKLVDELIQQLYQSIETWPLLWIQFPALQHNGITARKHQVAIFSQLVKDCTWSKSEYLEIRIMLPQLRTTFIQLHYTNNYNDSIPCTWIRQHTTCILSCTLMCTCVNRIWSAHINRQQLFLVYRRFATAYSVLMFWNGF